MTITIHPCRLCPIRENCEKRAHLRNLASSSGALSITYHCDRLAAEMRPGRRIIIKVPHLIGHDPDDGSPRVVTQDARATITGVSLRQMFTCTVDPEDDRHPGDDGDVRDPSMLRFRRARKHSTIVRMLDEPDMPVCKAGCVQRNGSCDPPRGACQCADEAALARAFPND
jgi:hypothetical protein